MARFDPNTLVVLVLAGLFVLFVAGIVFPAGEFTPGELLEEGVPAFLVNILLLLGAIFLGFVLINQVRRGSIGRQTLFTMIIAAVALFFVAKFVCGLDVGICPLGTVEAITQSIVP